MMYTVHEGIPSPLPIGEEEQEKVREQLNRLLETHHFKNSKRYPPLLRFIVEETLAGRGEFLKERLLGVRVFNRPADYDTAADPIVRVTIAEIRKRIAQYYHDEEHDAEVRIELLPGHYVPEFRARTGRRESTLLAPSSVEIAELQSRTLPQQGASANQAHLAASASVAEAAPGVARKPFNKRLYWIGAAAIVVLSLVSIPVAHWLHPSALEEMWNPLLASPRAVLFCVPTDVGMKRGPTGEPESKIQPATKGGVPSPASPAGPTFLQWEALGENIVYSDMLATLRIANVLAVHHRDYRARLNTTTTLEDLRQGPSVLIGGLDNQWTMRALEPLRFGFSGSDEDRYWISDAKSPSFKDWSLDLKKSYGAVNRDYAIVARLHNEQTGQPQVIVAGIGMSGTAAAGEFISDPRRLEELRERIGPGFKDHDFEVVLGTDVVNGMAGAPKILAVSTW